jgi:hypothetical protein
MRIERGRPVVVRPVLRFLAGVLGLFFLGIGLLALLDNSISLPLNLTFLAMGAYMFSVCVRGRGFKSHNDAVVLGSRNPGSNGRDG